MVVAEVTSHRQPRTYYMVTEYHQYQHDTESPPVRKHVQHNFDTSQQSPLLPPGGQSHFPSAKATNTVIQSVYSFCCSTIGAGIVSLPAAIRKGGFVAAFVIVLVAIIANYTARRLIKCLTMTGTLLNSYSDIGQAAYGRWAYFVTITLQCITLFGVCTIFLILFGLNMSALVPQVTVHDWVLVMGFVLLPVTWLKSMKEIHWLGLFGIIASLFAAVVIVVSGISTAVHNYPTTHHTFVLGGISSAFNIIVFSFGGHSVLPSIALEMRDINSFPTMAGISYTLIGTVYTIVGVCGYLGYGAAVHSNVLSDVSNSWGKAAMALISAHLFLAYCIPMYPLARYLEAATGVRDMRTGSSQELRARIVLRSCLVIATMLIASVVPYFGDVLSLVSALSIVLIVFFFPLLFHMRLAQLNDVHIPLSEQWINFAIMIIGVVGTVVGTYYGFKGLSHDVKTGGNPFLHFFTN